MNELELATLKRQYWSDGFVVLKSPFTKEEVNTWKCEASRLWALPGLLDDLNLRTEYRRDVSGTFVLDRLDPVLDVSKIFLQLILDKRLGFALKAILGGPAVPLKCKLIRKDPLVNGYLPHQDFRYWQWLNIPPDHLCSVAISFNRSTPESGGIEIFPGLHHRLLASPPDRPDDDFDFSKIDATRGIVPCLDPGDMLVFHSLAPHKSGPNTSDAPRTILLPSYATGAHARLYTRYQMYEAERRGRHLVGFERYNVVLSSMEEAIAWSL